LSPRAHTLGHDGGVLAVLISRTRAWRCGSGTWSVALAFGWHAWVLALHSADRAALPDAHGRLHIRGQSPQTCKRHNRELRHQRSLLFEDIPPPWHALSHSVYFLFLSARFRLVTSSAWSPRDSNHVPHHWDARWEELVAASVASKLGIGPSPPVWLSYVLPLPV